MNETPSERQFRIAPATMTDVAARKDSPGSTSENLFAAVTRLLEELVARGWSQNAIARAIGMSAPGVGNWLKEEGERKAPSWQNFSRLSALAAAAREGRVIPGDDASWLSKPGVHLPIDELISEVGHSEQPMADRDAKKDKRASTPKSAVVTSVPSPVIPLPVSQRGIERMASQIRYRELDRAEYPELEVCLRYHVRQLQDGIIGARTIEHARMGGFEPECTEQGWLAEDWWAQMLRLEAWAKAQFKHAPKPINPEKPEPPPRSNRS